MSHTYELIAIFQIEGLEQTRESFVQALEQAKMQIEQQQDLGEKILAYPIKKQTKGFYVSLDIKAESQDIHNLNQKLLNFPNLLRYLVVKKD